MRLLSVVQLPAALLLATALCSAAEPWLAVTVPPRTRESLPATIRMWYHLAWCGVLPSTAKELSKPVAAMHGSNLVLRGSACAQAAWIIHADGSVTREEIETFSGDWQQPSAVELERAAAVAAGMLPEDPPLLPDRLTVSARETAESWSIRWPLKAHGGACLGLRADGGISIGRWASSSSRCCGSACSFDHRPPSGGG